ncbi:MAG TPA: SAF domain-containing protein [Acidimicrobiia bacterium]|nr:SAF domain-containing protein [Acidimicrobiia bacterium]
MPSTKQREAGSHKPARRRVGRRLSATHVLIAVVVVLAFVLNLIVLQDRDATVLVAIAERPIATGSVLDAEAVRLVPVDADFEGLSGIVTEAEMAGYEGWVLNRSVAEGSIIEVTALGSPTTTPGLRTMSLPIPIEHAAGGQIVSGDRVDVIAVNDGLAEYIATNLEVVAVSEDGGGALGSVGGYHVVVNVEADQALALAAALNADSIELVRSTGADPAQVDGS